MQDDLHTAQLYKHGDVHVIDNIIIKPSFKVNLCYTL